jgi:hypothetical protein
VLGTFGTIPSLETRQHFVANSGPSPNLVGGVTENWLGANLNIFQGMWMPFHVSPITNYWGARAIGTRDLHDVSRP